MTVSLEKTEKDTQRHRVGQVRMEAETQGIQLQAKENQGELGANNSKRQGRILPQSLQREHDPAYTLLLGF